MSQNRLTAGLQALGYIRPMYLEHPTSTAAEIKKSCEGIVAVMGEANG